MSEDIALLALTDLLNAVEAGIEAARQTIRAGKVGLDIESIKWIRVEGVKGSYERSEDIENVNFKALLEALQAHRGKLSHDGYFFWLFPNGATVGRKKR